MTALPDATPSVPPIPPETAATRRARAGLLARIHRRYRTVTEPRVVGPMSVLFTRIADPDTVLDEVVEECDRIERDTGVRLQDPLHLPYWAELWDSAAGVGQILLEEWQSGGVVEWNGGPSADGARSPNDHRSTSPPLHPATPSRASVLDLGCGMGLSGTVAASLGADVLFADLETPALLFARLNSVPWTERVRTRRVNWQTDDLGERFDLILGADILYERKQWEFLDAFWRQHLAPGGTILLGEPGRQTGDTFLDWGPSRGWRLERFDRVVPTRPTPVRVLRLRLGQR